MFWWHTQLGVILMQHVSEKYFLMLCSALLLPNLYSYPWCIFLVWSTYYHMTVNSWRQKWVSSLHQYHGCTGILFFACFKLEQWELWIASVQQVCYYLIRGTFIINFSTQNTHTHIFCPSAYLKFCCLLFLKKYFLVTNRRTVNITQRI